MTPDSSPGFARELLDDFYTECDEQLGVLRNLVVEIENDTGSASAAAFEALFRTMHTLKGNAAIVGLREAEELAHAAEDFLKRLRTGDITLSSSRIDVLLRTVQRLELTVSAHRQQAPIPAVGDLVEILVALGASPAPAPAAAVPSPPPTPAPAPSPPGYRFLFSPSRALDEQGVNIASIRTRLSSAGTIVSARPRVENGGVTFEFIVEMPSPPDPATWNVAGLAYAGETGPSPASDSSPAPSPSAPVEASPVSADDQGAALFIAPSHLVRVDIGRLDDLLRIAGELVIHRSRLDDRLNQPVPDKNALKEVNLALTRSLRELREAITRVRLVPVAEVFARLPFVIRDLSRNSAKQARLILEGQHTEIDKYLVERLKEPLLHLVRNAFSHGIEAPQQRLASGKPEEGRIVLSASAEGGFVLIKIRDDGGGVDPSRIVARARSLRLPIPDTIDDKALLDLLCAPGFSTREESDRASGRGVGMSVVRNVVHQLGGTLLLQTSPGHSTQFTLRLPLTLSIVETLLFSVSGQLCAIPQNVVQEITEVVHADVRSIQRTLVMPYRDGVLPVVRLAKLFGHASPPEKKTGFVLVIRSDQGFAGLIVDRVIGRREVVVRPMDDPLIQVRGIAGATELGDGRPVLVLDALALLEGAVRPASVAERAAFSSQFS